jgi:hypothetical protein
MKTLINYILNKQFLKHFIKNPSDIRFLHHYLEIESKLVKLTEERKGKIKKLLNEAENIREYVVDKLSEFRAFHGAMISPLEGPIIYTMIRCFKPRIVVETVWLKFMNQTQPIKACHRFVICFMNIKKNIK